MENRFAKQVAIVTGGAEGIGKSIARRLALEGALVTIFDINLQSAELTAAAFASEGVCVDYEIVDIASKDQVKGAIESVQARNGGNLDIMVNCAAILGPTATNIEHISIADFDKVFETNVRGTFLMTKYSIPVMKRNSYGRILNFASIAGKEGHSGMCPYSASKAAVIGLVKSVGKEYAGSGITINAIAPDLIKTPMLEAIDPKHASDMESRIPMGRCGTLEEITALSCWIVSPESSFNTGFTFDLSGGRAVY